MRRQNEKFFAASMSCTQTLQPAPALANPGADPRYYLEGCEQRGGRRKAQPMRHATTDIYFETQVDSHCLVHAWNNMQQPPTEQTLRTYPR